MWGNMFGEVKLGKADYTVVREKAQKNLEKITFLIKPRTCVKYNV